MADARIFDEWLTDPRDLTLSEFTAEQCEKVAPGHVVFEERQQCLTYVRTEPFEEGVWYNLRFGWEWPRGFVNADHTLSVQRSSPGGSDG